MPLACLAIRPTPETAGVLGLIVQMWSENVWGTNPQGSTVFERQPHASTMTGQTCTANS